MRNNKLGWVLAGVVVVVALVLIVKLQLQPGAATPEASLPVEPAPQIGGSTASYYPPTIPHEVANRANCLACHQQEIKPPVTPHPERSNCTQCHMPLPDKGTSIPAGGIPMIPHQVQGRENCLSCHQQEIRPPVTPHPERTNCIQCHVTQQG